MSPELGFIRGNRLRTSGWRQIGRRTRRPHAFKRLELQTALVLHRGRKGTRRGSDSHHGSQWDYASWTQLAANFVAGLKAGDFGVETKGYLIALSGEASPMVKAKLEAMGVKIATRLAPGPLK